MNSPMNSPSDVKVPELAVCRCGNPEHQPQVAEVGATLLCQNCVNDFLARHVGLMAQDRPQVVEAPQEPQGFHPPRVESGGTG